MGCLTPKSRFNRHAPAVGRSSTARAAFSVTGCQWLGVGRHFTLFEGPFKVGT